MVQVLPPGSPEAGGIGDSVLAVLIVRSLRPILRGNLGLAGESLRQLRFLYSNYFQRYCTSPVARVGDDDRGGHLEFLCYMFWDIFVVYPGNASADMVDACLEVMIFAVSLPNERCVVSGLHGLGHFAYLDARVPSIVDAWLRQPTVDNPEIERYAKIAREGAVQ